MNFKYWWHTNGCPNPKTLQRKNWNLKMSFICNACKLGCCIFRWCGLKRMDVFGLSILTALKPTLIEENWHVLVVIHGGSDGKESTCNVGDLGSTPGLSRYPGEENGYPLQYSGLENLMDYTVRGVAKSQTWLSDSHFHLVVRGVHRNKKKRERNTGPARRKYQAKNGRNVCIDNLLKLTLSKITGLS